MSPFLIRITDRNGSLARLAAFLLGVLESHEACGMTWDDDSGSPRSVAYDHGRNLGERMVPICFKR